MPEIPIQTTEVPDEFCTMVFPLPGDSAGVQERSRYPLFVADRTFILDAAWARWSTAESTAATLNLVLYRVADGVAIGDATEIPLTADGSVSQGGSTPDRVNAKATANTVYNATVLYEEPSGSGVTRNTIPAGALVYAEFQLDNGTATAPTELANAVIGLRLRTRLR